MQFHRIEGTFMRRRVIITMLGTLAMVAMFPGTAVFSNAVAQNSNGGAQNSNGGRQNSNGGADQHEGGTPIYNPYPPGIPPSDLESELARVLREVDVIEARAIQRWQALPRPTLTGQPPTLQNTGTEA